MKVHLYNPPISYKSEWAPAAYPLISLPILSAILNQAGIETMVFDMEAMHKRPRDIQRPFPDVIGLTCMTANRQGVMDMIECLIVSGFEGRIVCGGIYASVFPEEVLDYGCDLVVTGECEANIVDLIKSGATGIHKGIPTAIENIPVPDWDHHEPDITTYKGNMNIIGDTPGIAMWSRGCPGKCIFCENIIFKGSVVRVRPPCNIQQSMVNLYQRGISNVFLYDDDLVGVRHPEGWLHEIADRIEPLKMRMIAQGRCSARYITPEIMQDVKRAGVHTIFWGVESMSQDVLYAIRKGITVNDVYQSLRISKAAGVRNGLYLQIGQYKETEAEAKETARHLKALQGEGLIDYINVFVNTVMPGTELAEIAINEGWYQPIPHGYRSMKHAMKEGTPWMTRKQIHKWKREFETICGKPKLWDRSKSVETVPAQA